MNEIILYVIAGCAVIALIYAGIFVSMIMSQKVENKKMAEIAEAIHEGAMAFLFREYKVLSGFVLVVAVLLGVFINVQTAIAFVYGAVSSGIAGFVGMKVATKANVRTTQAASTSLSAALKVAFSSGAVMGMSVVGLGLLGVTVLYIVWGNPEYIYGFSFGASSIALFARVGGGIFTKAADVGADLVGKVEAGIPEDDPRNPAVIADNVGDNVGDVAGMGADLFESYVGSIVATMALAVAASMDSIAIILPLIIAATGILCSIIGTFFVRTNDETKIHQALSRGLWVASALVTVAIFFIVKYTMPDLNVFYASVVGLVAGVLIGLLTEWYTSADYRHVQRIAKI